eukprot:TRINITY_DN33494_c0_g1_i1.p1 TRINITY_DN33494_c0_g1~~TRINITY_DN33494_c0_g1_i1.p1  ORF type:complete len:188 (+),score=41.85 TRINITY_DN33494_c0_g1_i1:58-564(+)
MADTKQSPGPCGPADVPAAQHATRDLREPVSRALSAAGREGILSPDGDVAFWTQNSFRSVPDGLQQEMMSPSLPADSSPLDARQPGRSLFPIRAEVDGRGSEAGPMFGGSLVEPSSLLGASPCMGHMASDTPGRKALSNVSPLSGAAGTPLPPPELGGATPTRGTESR